MDSLSLFEKQTETRRYSSIHMAKTILILGGSGKVALNLTKLLTSRGDTVHSLVRNPEQVSTLTSLGAKPFIQSLDDSSVSDLAATLAHLKPDVVVWSAGAGGKGGPERTKAIDQDAAIRSMDAMAQVARDNGGTKRYIMVSAVDVRDRDGKPVPDWYSEADKARSDKTWGAIGKYMLAKLEADKSLVTRNKERGLEYTIVRPSGLTMEKGSGKVAVGKVGCTRSVSREDVAAVLVGVIDEPKTAGCVFDLVGGEGGEDEMDIIEAVRKVGAKQIDTFEGHY